VALLGGAGQIAPSREPARDLRVGGRRRPTRSAAIGRGLVPTVRCGVLAEAWRGGPQHQLSPLLRGCKVEELSEEQARQVGGLIAGSGLDDTVDVAVAEEALRRNDAVVTSNRSRIAQVANAAGKRIAMHDV